MNEKVDNDLQFDFFFLRIGVACLHKGLLSLQLLIYANSKSDKLYLFFFFPCNLLQFITGKVNSDPHLSAVPPMYSVLAIGF